MKKLDMMETQLSSQHPEDKMQKDLYEFKFNLLYT